MVDGRKLTARLCAALADANIIQHENPAFRLKAVKNDVELDNLRKAHVRDRRDGAARRAERVAQVVF